MKLKTLKDISFEGTEDRPTEWFVTTAALKQEAIKWIKYKLTHQSLAVQRQLWMNEGMIMAFQTFFNITEKDLK